MIKVAIANDTLITLEALRRMIATDTAYQLIWTARDGEEAVTKAKLNPPDLILMDLLMPKMSGVEATRQIMAHTPCAILIVTGNIRSNTSIVFEAMSCGALDVVQTPTIASRGTTQKIIEEIRTAAQPLLAKMVTVSKVVGKYKKAQTTNIERDGSQEKTSSLVLIGASTGGPKAIAKVLSQLSASFPAAIVVVQHIDPQFVGGLAAWLNSQSALPVRIATQGDSPISGEVLLAGGSGHLKMNKSCKLTYISNEAPEASETFYQPSVDVLFKSVAQHWRSRGQAVLLTGMGSDGAVGLKTLRSLGWRTIAESKESCVVYGMPRAAAELGAVDTVLSAAEIARALEDRTVPASTIE